MGQRHAKEPVTRLQQRQEYCLVRLRAGMRLDIGITCTKELLQPVNGQIFDRVHMFATAIIAAARVTFGIFVGQHRPLRLQNGLGNDVFGCD